ncbi:tRNA-uridine aminocarboxypropyltransferase [Shewanella sp. SNU WT4]|uniref:DTW domain-containing protein n=1 Tax=Shewanella sp. SNU WT4 TaxID=2590015 RepID=UPI00143CC4F6|nr:tRNA-uridine aminocarboxypropyltransferase [Shewanella sp. SNU WT4]
MNIILLTHEREFERVSNTGQWVINALPLRSERRLWSRTAPDQALVNDLASGKARLVFPSSEITNTSLMDADTNANSCKHANFVSTLECTALVLIDATWQEARKMWRQSPYLQQASLYPLLPTEPSQYALRRNQVPSGLSTAECVIALFKQLNEPDNADIIQQVFEQMNQR